MNGCLPIFTNILNWIWIGQRSRFSQIVGLGIILTGVILVGYEGFVSSDGAMTWLGDFLFHQETAAAGEYGKKGP